MFEVGKKVICIKTHSGCAPIVKGKIFEVEGIRKSVCKCEGIEINVGIDGRGKGVSCPRCGFKGDNPERYWWFAPTLFAPIETQPLSTTTVEELLEVIECTENYIDMNRYYKLEQENAYHAS